MFTSLARKIFGTANDRLVKSYRHRYVEKINALEPEISKLSDHDLAAQTGKFKEKLAQGAKLDDLIPEAFATVREAAKRVLGMRHFDVQLIGGLVLHNNMIAEMKTGEGKTLVATLPAYLNALTGKGVHVVTVNDYLAKRDAEWMGKIYTFLGLTVDTIVHEKGDEGRQKAYRADITYGTNNEFGFDYLRDNMKFHREEMVQRPFNYAIVDEVDSILVDEARTPLIISGPTEDSSELYQAIDLVIPELQEGEFEKDEKSRAVSLTEAGMERMEQLLKERGLLAVEKSLYDVTSVSLVHHVNQALRAHKLFSRDVDYIVKDNKVIIIDEFTGRMMEGRRYSEGLHQALEAKEKVRIQQENQTLASITFQNYFRLYPKLAGMTGTAMTEAQEFRDIYGLEVVDIPTNVPVGRVDYNDEIYRTAREKYEAIVELIEECHAKGQPVLVGTVSIEKSEHLSAFLKKKKIAHQVLNARYHEKEAHIIAQAGRPGAVTIATNMAGRGTDIMLGGNPDMLIRQEFGEEEPAPGTKEWLKAEQLRTQVAEDKKKVLEAGGLYVIGTERHESRRIDNQLRGRSGRQGDPGASKFYLSLEDDLLRIFGSERMDLFLRKMGLKEGEKITHPWMNKALEKAQQKVEGRNYDIRKNLLKFDDVMNDQRKVIYEQRIELMEAEDVAETVAGMREEVNTALVASCIPDRSFPDQWDTERLEQAVRHTYGLDLPIKKWAEESDITQHAMLERLHKATAEHIAAKEQLYSPEIFRFVEKRLLLQTLDHLWKDHLLSLDHLRQGINLRAYGQRDPLNEYKQEAFSLFERMLTGLREEVTSRLAHLEIQVGGMEEMAFDNPYHDARESRQDPGVPQGFESAEVQAQASITPLRTHIAPEDRDASDPDSWGKVRRNEDCPCGSGKKYKHCHGTLE